MKIEEHLRKNDMNTYMELSKLYENENKKEKKIKLGDTIENLMGHDSYQRKGRRIKQRRWG
jgi:hypothetical protein